MRVADEVYDAVIIGGGFYGCVIAVYLAEQRGWRKLLLVEREDALLLRASYTNQARVHNGYHYPRSFTTAFRSRVNLPRFLRDWPAAVKNDFTKIYAIAEKNSKVTAKQFVRFCREIGAEVEPATAAHRMLFDSKLVEAVFQVNEPAFDTRELAKWARASLERTNVEVMLSTRVRSVHRAEGLFRVGLTGPSRDELQKKSRHVFNCTYSSLNHVGADAPAGRAKLKHEITEMALVALPPSLGNLGVTVMDGPFFSFMPFPARGLHTFSHVRYTPHLHWLDSPAIDPYTRLESYTRESRFDRMFRDGLRYMPALADTKYIDSLYEIKTILTKNESDDGRPILFERHPSWPGFYSVLGGKIDNVYDIVEKMNTEAFDD